MEVLLLLKWEAFLLECSTSNDHWEQKSIVIIIKMKGAGLHLVPEFRLSAGASSLTLQLRGVQPFHFTVRPYFQGAGSARLKWASVFIYFFTFGLFHFCGQSLSSPSVKHLQMLLTLFVAFFRPGQSSFEMIAPPNDQRLELQQSCQTLEGGVIFSIFIKYLIVKLP